MQVSRIRAAAAAAAGAVLVVAGVAAASATATASYAPAGTAKIHPGVMMYTKGAQCTANFVYKDAAGHTYVGYAAHCAGTGAATDTNGCKTKSLPLGTKVRFAEGGSIVSGGTTVGYGKLAYSSWRSMDRLGTKNGNQCAYNDLALVRVAKNDVHDVNPTVPVWGGPTGVATHGTKQGDRVYSYGNSSLRGGVTQLSPKSGISQGDSARHWTRTVYTASPGIPGDSGSGYLDQHGRALGVLSTIELAPEPGANGVGDLPRELAFAQKHSGIAGLKLVKGTKKFNPNAWPAG